MTSTKAHLMDLVFSRAQSHVLYAGVKLGVFDVIADEPTPAHEITDAVDIDPELGYRLLRALTSVEVLNEGPNRTFSLTPAGELLTTDHPETVHDFILFEGHPMHASLWSRLPDLIREGDQNAFVQEFGSPLFDYFETNPEYAAVFNDGMSSYSRMHTTSVQELFADVEFGDGSHVCDVGGGHGYLLCTLLSEYPSLEGTVLELPSVVEQDTDHWASKLSVADRCSYVAGDMFEAVPSADIYLLKHIIHTWDDEKAKQILSTIHDNAPEAARVFIIEHIIPDSDTPHFGELLDIYMMVLGLGRERTTDEYTELLAESGWTYVDTRYPQNELLGAVEAIKSSQNTI